MVRLPARWPGLTAVETKVILGAASVLKKSELRRCPSRSALLVSTELKSTSAVTELAAASVSTCTVPVKELKRPRTLDRPRWRTVKPTSLCAGSTAQVPEAMVGVVTVDMGGLLVQG